MGSRSRGSDPGFDVPRTWSSLSQANSRGHVDADVTQSVLEFASAMEIAPALDADALRRARERAGLSQNELARRAGLAAGGRVSRWERGEARPRNPRTLHTLAQALGIDARELLLPPESGPTLRWLRFAAGLSVDELAVAANSGVSTVKRWEAEGHAAPSAATLSVLATALSTTTETVRRALTS